MCSAELHNYFLNVLGLKPRDLSYLEVAVGSVGGNIFRYNAGDPVEDVQGGLTPVHYTVLRGQ